MYLSDVIQLDYADGEVTGSSRQTQVGVVYGEVGDGRREPQQQALWSALGEGGEGGGRRERVSNFLLLQRSWVWVRAYLSGERLHRMVVCCHSNQAPPTEAVRGNG